MSAIKKLYHNTTAEYNGYFNADVLMQQTMLSLTTQHEDNYTRVLDLYPYMGVKDVQGIYPDMDKAIEKVSVVIALHRVSDWTDDCYLLMGQAQYLKRDFESAEETLEYMTDEFNPEKTEQRRKKALSRKSKKEQQKVREKEQKEKQEARAEEKKEKEKTRKEQARDKKKEQARKKKEREREAKERARAKKKGKPLPPKKKVEDPDNSKDEDPEISGKEVPTKAQLDSIAAKKEAEKPKPDPDNYFLKHRPCYQEGVLWLARTYIERQMYDDAWRLLTKLEKDPKTFKDVRRDLAQVQAYYFLKQKQYNKALPYLELALSQIKKKKDKARVAYIVAQIKQLENGGSEAYNAFATVLKYSPTYEMEFNARLNMILNAWLSGRGSAEGAIADLSKMSKDSKNTEFLDQIYFTMAKIALKDNQRTQAMAYLRQSLDNSKGNQAQKAEAYYLLATLYHEDEDYVQAKNYYDSTKTTMSDKDDRYADVTKYASNLADIAKYIGVVTLQDSLLRIAGMSEKEQKELAKRLLAEQEKLKEAQAIAAAPAAATPGSRFAATGPRMTPDGMPAIPTAIGAGTKPSTFFAYTDQVGLRKQQRDFEKKWGDRKNEDNWRRTNKRSTDSDITDIVSGDSTQADSGNEDWRNLLRDVPKTPEEVAAANQKIEDAFYQLGVLFYDRIQNYKRSVGSHETLLKRYPETKQELQAWYYLYLSHTALNNRTEAKLYYDKIVAKYPTTTYARVLQDPDYAKKSREEENKLARYYDETYRLFTAGQAATALQRIDEAPKKFGADNEFKVKFALLRAMCTGKTESKDVYIAGLKDVVAKYPNTPEQKRAKEMLRLLEGGKAEPEEGGIKPGGVAATATGNFSDAPENQHYVIIVMTGKNISLDKAKGDVSDYNRTNFKIEDLKVTNIFLGSDTNRPTLVIRKFNTKADALRYYEAAEADRDGYINIPNLDFEIFAISQDNYRELLRTKNLDDYRAFYEENYLNGE